MVIQTSRAASPAIVNVTSKQVRSYAAEARASPTEVSSILEQRIRGVQEEAGLAETGRVLSVGCANRPLSPSTPTFPKHAPPRLGELKLLTLGL